ncbi:hypothetical protein FSP39_007100 [Pinctada imbricata]|uniref:Uncharacterized protein n=1 Tax=Pinctada imbricata TaxID=66713 RepID=A0AA88Y9J2_PINIB|nr:hypothetical protein FSP39_007100 [Pinctada imbricata]
MKFYAEGANIRISGGRKTAKWTKNAIDAEGYVFSKESLLIHTGEICQLDLDVVEYGGVSIGLLFKNPEEYRNQVAEFFEPGRSNGVREISYLTLKNRKTAHVEFKHVPGLDDYIEVKDSISPEPMQIEIPYRQRSFWIFVRFVFGDIRVSLRGIDRRLCHWQNIGSLSRNTKLNDDASAQLKDQYAGSRCKMDHLLKPGDKLRLKVTSTVQRGRGFRSVFRILFASEHTVTMPLGTEPPYQRKNFSGDVVILHRGNSVLFQDKHDTRWELESQEALKMHTEIVLSSVEIVDYEENSAKQPQGLKQSARPMSEIVAYGPYEESNANPEAGGATGPAKNYSLQIPGPTACHQDVNAYDNPVTCKRILRRNYDVLVRCIDFNRIADILYRDGIMEDKDHRKITMNEGRMDDDIRRRQTLNWMIDNDEKISESEIQKILTEVASSLQCCFGHRLYLTLQSSESSPHEIPRSRTDIQRGRVVGSLSSLKMFGQSPSWNKGGDLQQHQVAAPTAKPKNTQCKNTEQTSTERGAKGTRNVYAQHRNIKHKGLHVNQRDQWAT